MSADVGAGGSAPPAGAAAATAVGNGVSAGRESSPRGGRQRQQHHQQQQQQKQQIREREREQRHEQEQAKRHSRDVLSERNAEGSRGGGGVVGGPSAPHRLAGGGGGGGGGGRNGAEPSAENTSSSQKTTPLDAADCRTKQHQRNSQQQQPPPPSASGRPPASGAAAGAVPGSPTVAQQQRQKHAKHALAGVLESRDAGSAKDQSPDQGGVVEGGKGRRRGSDGDGGSRQKDGIDEGSGRRNGREHRADAAAGGAGHNGVEGNDGRLREDGDPRSEGREPRPGREGGRKEVWRPVDGQGPQEHRGEPHEDRPSDHKGGVGGARGSAWRGGKGSWWSTPSELQTFNSEVKAWASEQGVELKHARFHGSDVDLLRLWRIVGYLGGFDVVSQRRQWTAVAQLFDLPNSCTSGGHTYKHFFETALLGFERQRGVPSREDLGEPFAGLRALAHSHSFGKSGLSSSLGPVHGEGNCREGDVGSLKRPGEARAQDLAWNKKVRKGTAGEEDVDQRGAAGVAGDGERERDGRRVGGDRGLDRGGERGEGADRGERALVSRGHRPAGPPLQPNRPKKARALGSAAAAVARAAAPSAAAAAAAVAADVGEVATAAAPATAAGGTAAAGKEGGSVVLIDVGEPCDWVKVNVRRAADRFEVYALVPGLLREEIHVQAEEPARITIAGSPEVEDNPWGLRSFKKVLLLPSPIAVTATYCVVSLHGQLFIHAPLLQQPAAVPSGPAATAAERSLGAATGGPGLADKVGVELKGTTGSAAAASHAACGEAAAT